MLADGGHDDHKHDPVGNVHKAKGHNCPSIKWPFFCSAAGEGGKGGGEREGERERGREGREREREGEREEEKEGGRERGTAVIKCVLSKLNIAAYYIATAYYGSV